LASCSKAGLGGIIVREGKAVTESATRHSSVPCGIGIKRSTGHTHTHTHTPTENNTPDTDTHAHGKNNTPNPQTNTSQKHLTTLEGNATTVDVWGGGGGAELYAREIQ